MLKCEYDVISLLTDYRTSQRPVKRSLSEENPMKEVGIEVTRWRKNLRLSLLYTFIFTITAWFNHVVYLANAPRWDEDVIVSNLIRRQPPTDGHFVFEATVLTWGEAGFAAFALICAFVAVYRLYTARRQG